jgi:ATP adenylyltransferase/5',5'''-P-1,P-4-tetraphosphate phosphorylase II
LKLFIAADQRQRGSFPIALHDEALGHISTSPTVCIGGVVFASSMIQRSTRPETRKARRPNPFAVPNLAQSAEKPAVNHPDRPRESSETSTTGILRLEL